MMKFLDKTKTKIVRLGPNVQDQDLELEDQGVQRHISPSREHDICFLQVKDNCAGLVKQIAGVLRHSTDFAKVLPLPRARCPVIKFVHIPSGIKCDMSINNRSAID